MKARVRYNNTEDVVGNLTFNKNLNLYKVASDATNIYIPGSTLNYAVEIATPTKRRSTRRRKK